MAVNVNTYMAKMGNRRTQVTLVKQEALERQAANKQMKEVADAASDPTLELTGAQKAALLNDQLSATQALQTILDDAITAITP